MTNSLKKHRSDRVLDVEIVYVLAKSISCRNGSECSVAYEEDLPPRNDAKQIVSQKMDQRVVETHSALYVVVMLDSQMPIYRPDRLYRTI